MSLARSAELKKVTKVCAYDRAGMGKSSPVAHPHSNRQMVLGDASPMPPPFEFIPKRRLVEFERNIRELEGLDVMTMRAGYEELQASKRSPLVVLIAGRAHPDPFCKRHVPKKCS